MLNKQIDGAWALVEQLLGRLACVQLLRVSTNTQLSEESRELLQEQPARLQLLPPSAALLPPSALLQLLYALAVLPVPRLADPTLRGSHWHDCALPRVEF